MGIIFPSFFKVMAVVVGIWDQQISVLSVVSILTASAQSLGLKVLLYSDKELDKQRDKRLALVAVFSGIFGRLLTKMFIYIYFCPSLVSFWVL